MGTTHVLTKRNCFKELNTFCIYDVHILRFNSKRVALQTYVQHVSVFHRRRVLGERKINSRWPRSHPHTSFRARRTTGIRASKIRATHIPESSWPGTRSRPEQLVVYGEPSSLARFASDTDPDPDPDIKTHAFKLLDLLLAIKRGVGSSGRSGGKSAGPGKLAGPPGSTSGAAPSSRFQLNSSHLGRRGNDTLWSGAGRTVEHWPRLRVARSGWGRAHGPFSRTREFHVVASRSVSGTRTPGNATETQPHVCGVRKRLSDYNYILIYWSIVKYGVHKTRGTIWINLERVRVTFVGNSFHPVEGLFKKGFAELLHGYC